MNRILVKTGIGVVSLLLLLSACGGEKAKKEVTEADRQQAKALVEKGKNFASQGAAQSEQAVKAFKEAIQLYPTYAAAYNALGMVQRERRQFTEARQSLQKAIELDADYAEAYMNLGFVYYVDGVLDKAIESHRKAIEHKADYGEAHYYLGKAYVGQGKLADARQHIQKSKELGFTPEP